MPLRFTGTARATTAAADIEAASGGGGFSNTYSVDFDGTNDYLVVSDVDGLSPGDSVSDTAFSIIAHIKADVTSAFRIAAKGNGTTQREYLFTLDANSKLTIALYDLVSGSEIVGRYNTALSAGTWYRVAVTYSGNSSISGVNLYVDGSSVAVTDGSAGGYTAMHNTTGDFLIGAWDVAGFANGHIDELAYFQKELTSGEITTAHGTSSAVDISSLSPYGWWRMGDNDGGTGTTVTDQGSGGNNATLTNGPTFSTDIPT